jgi:hypothetical protein
VDKPVTTEEQLSDAVSQLRTAVTKIRELLQILACEAIVSGGGWINADPDDGSCTDL